MTIVITGRATGRSLVSSYLFERLCRRIESEEKLGRDLTARIVDQALAFLAACATNTGPPLVPSELVDIGWHTFILHTREYAAFCTRVAGRFLHHVPTDGDDSPVDGGTGHGTLVRTRAAIEAAGFVVDDSLWPRSTADSCTGCHNGCHDDPPPPTPCYQ